MNTNRGMSSRNKALTEAINSYAERGLTLEVDEQACSNSRQGSDKTRICPYCQNSLPAEQDPCSYCGRYEPADEETLREIEKQEMRNGCLLTLFAGLLEGLFSFILNILFQG